MTIKKEGLRNKKIIFLVISVSLVCFNFYLVNGFAREQLITRNWINNPSFTTTDHWNLNKGKLGDSSDVNGSINNGKADFLVLGDYGEIKIDEPLDSGNWLSFQNPYLPILPDSYGINQSGCYVSHTWHESIDQTRNNPSIQWKRNITLPIDMSDHIITSASLSAYFNASVQALDHDGGGIEVYGDYTEGQNPPTDTQFGIGDFATFYVLISDLNNTYPFIVASNQTTTLGQDSPIVSSYPDSPMNVISEDILIAYLTSALSSDNFNFTITLGIDIYSEDNEYNVDIDRWSSLIIRNFNLTFTYEKKVDRYTTISFNQIGDSITGNNTRILDANLRFKYKIDQNWTISSPNSEIRIIINNNTHSEAVKLRSYTYSDTFQDAKLDGFNVTALILKDVNISTAIQVYIADSFGLGETIIISIDDLYLTISYILITEDLLEPWLYAGLFIIAAMITTVITGLLIAYIKVWRFPIPIRKVRKHKKALLDEKDPDVKIISREGAFKRNYAGEIDKTAKILKGTPLDGKIEKDKLFKEEAKTIKK
ncbi:MAG: hypothetical protein ACFFFB_09615 [Candidatus Heimdallarchaeota archaeon]